MNLIKQHLPAGYRGLLLFLLIFPSTIVCAKTHSPISLNSISSESEQNLDDTLNVSLEEVSITYDFKKSDPKKNPDDVRESLFPDKSLSLVSSHFTWGADLGSSIDLSGNDQSTFNADVVFGYKNHIIRILGAGAGVHRSIGSGDNFIPVYLIFRSSFSRSHKLLFMNLKAGYSFNTIGNAATYGDSAASIGLGFNLAMSRKFMSHIIINYGFRHFSKLHRDMIGIAHRDVHLAELSFGINF